MTWFIKNSIQAYYLKFKSKKLENIGMKRFSVKIKKISKISCTIIIILTEMI